MTLGHRPRSGDHVWPGWLHHLPPGPAQQRRGAHHRLQLRRGAPGGVPVGDGGPHRGHQDHPRRPAVQPHLRVGRPVCAHPPRNRHRLHRRADQLRPHQRAMVHRVRPRLHQRRSRRRRGHRTARRARRPVQRLGHRRGPLRHGHLAVRAGRIRGGRHRPDVRPPALRHVAVAAPLRPLHAGDGVRHLWHRPRCVRPGRRHVHGGVGSGPHRHGLLRRRAHHALQRCAEHPLVGRVAVAAGQHRPSWRWHLGVAGPRQRAGCDRPAGAVRPVARLPAQAHGRRCRSGRIPGAGRQADRLVGQHARLCRVAAEGVVRRRRHR